MGSFYAIAGRRFRRRSILKLSIDERAAIDRDGKVDVLRPIEWPLEDRRPMFERAYVDPGGTDIWGPGPYLKVPNWHPEDREVVVNRVFCPWGHPPEPLRDFRRSRRMTIEKVDVVRQNEASWVWMLSLRLGVRG